MEIKPKYGVGDLLFGMKQQHVVAMYGKPSSQFKDEDGNIIYMYNPHKMRLTFYKDEDFRLGYIVISHPDSLLFGKKVMGLPTKEVTGFLEEKHFKNWETTEEDGMENVFNEENWLMLIAEYNEIVKVEVGAVFNNQDEFDWKFSG